jgi:hypothetical protein
MSYMYELESADGGTFAIGISHVMYCVTLHHLLVIGLLSTSDDIDDEEDDTKQEQASTTTSSSQSSHVGDIYDRSAMAERLLTRLPHASTMDTVLPMRAFMDQIKMALADWAASHPGEIVTKQVDICVCQYCHHRRIFVIHYYYDDGIGGRIRYGKRKGSGSGC